MSRLQRIRRQAMSIRGGIAVVGTLAVALGITQTAGTLAAPDLERTVKVPIASANYYPTPLTTEVRCRTTGGANLAGRRAEVSWNPVAEATGYRLEILTWNSSNPDTTIKQTHTLGAGTTTVGGIRDEDRDVLYARVRTINGPAVSSGYATPPQRISFKAWLGGQTECENTGHPTRLNEPWENSQSWSPEVGSFGVGQPLVNALRENAGGVDDAEDLAADANLDAAAETSEAQALEASATETASATTSPLTSVPRTRSSIAPTTAPTGGSTTSSSSTSVPTTARTTTTSTTAPAATNSTTVAVVATPVRLPGGGEAEIVGGTKLIVTETGAPECTARVREASTLQVRDGALEVTDALGTRVVDPESCELS